MITTSSAFKDAIKANVVRTKAKVVFNFSTPLTISQDKVIRINVAQRGEKALGCLQDDKITVTLKEGSLTSVQYGQDVTVSVYLGCVVNGADEFCCIGKFKVTRWEKSDYAIEIELGANVPDKSINEVLARDNVSLKSYIVTATSALLSETITLGAVTDGTLSTAYLYYKTIKEQLSAFAFACQGIFRSGENGFELVPYNFGEPVATYTMGSEGLILDKSGNTTDLVTTKTNYAISRSAFTKEEDTTLYSISSYRVDDPVYLNFSFSSPGLVQYLNFKKYSYFNSLTYGLWGGKICLYSGYVGETATIDLSIIGTKIVSSALGRNDGTKTYLVNPYIQTSAQVNALSLDVYNGQSYSFKSRIDPSLQVGDTIAIDGVGTMLVTGISYKFDGGLSGTIEGVLKDDQ